MNDAQIPEDDGIQPADIRAVRGEGGSELRALMRAQIAIGRARREPAEKQPPAKPPGHRPGVWPPGVRPPDPPPPAPPGAWDAAVARYRNGIPDGPCQCRPCRQLREIRPEEDQ